MSMLTLIQRFCRRTNLTVPSTVYGTSDKQVRQILALLEEEGNDLSSRGDWEALTNEATHTTVALEDQGSMATIASNGFRYIKHNTIWDRNLSEPVYGGISGQDWQAIKATAVTGPTLPIPYSRRASSVESGTDCRAYMGIRVHQLQLDHRFCWNHLQAVFHG